MARLRIANNPDKTTKEKDEKPGAGLRHMIAVVMAIVFIAAFLGFS